MNAADRFLQYIRIDTSCENDSKTVPSTARQLDLANLLVDELAQLGLQDITLEESGIVMATLPANVQTSVPVIGFIAHMDTIPDMPGRCLNPHIIENYQGGDIVLNEEMKMVLSPADFPELVNYTGQTLITTDGTTLLGADDKAGVAAIMAAMDYLTAHPEIRHGKIKVAFTPDEEIGDGVEHFDIQKFGADFAYTIDGGEVGELEYENFNAAEAHITFSGRSVHPGGAKNKMVNAIKVAMEFNAMLPAEQRPEHTEHYEGFFHLYSIHGAVEECKMHYTIRDFNLEKFEARKKLLEAAFDFLKSKYGAGIGTLLIRDQYYNMRDFILPVMHVVELAEKAIRSVGVEPIVHPIRGGTDGAKLSNKGLPTPNLFTGGHNFHGKYEYLPVESLDKAVEVIVKIAELNVE